MCGSKLDDTVTCDLGPLFFSFFLNFPMGGTYFMITKMPEVRLIAAGKMMNICSFISSG